MKILINGETREIAAATLAEVITVLGYKGDYFAVALNRACIPRSKQGTTAIKDFDEIEILSPMQGG